MIQHQTIRTLSPGECATIAKITALGELGRRIRDMGLVPGVEIQIMGRAPLNDPVEIKLRGYNLTLRNSEADHILIAPGGSKNGKRKHHHRSGR